MNTNLTTNDAICDLQGNPLHANSATLLKALDKLLTVGAYYSSEHSQYLQAAMKSRDDIVSVIGGASKQVAIEITAQGLMVGKQNIDPHHRNVRLLHELLVPLNIARLEIDGTLSPEDLRQALAALQEHKQTLGLSSSFQEIVIQNLPASVRAISCTVLHKSDESQDELSLDDLLGKWGAEDEAENKQGLETQSELLAREFMEMVTQILENLEQLEQELGVRPQHEEDGSYVTREDLANLKIALQRLAEVNPDPAELAKLIEQARKALDLSHDSRSVNLVFQILKKDLSKNKNDKGDTGKHKPQPVSYKMSVEQLLDNVTQLEHAEASIADPTKGSRSNQLGISLHLLRSDPPRALRTAMVDTIQQAVAEADFANGGLLLCAQAAHTIACQDGAEGVDDLLPVLTTAIRQKKPELVARFWSHLMETGAENQLPELWPHLVNDILLGVNKGPRELILPLLITAGSISMQDARRQGLRLEKQPAVQAATGARDLFLAPLTNTLPVFALLAGSPLQEWLGEELFRALRVSKISNLAEVVMASLAEHDPLNTAFYLDLIQYGHEETPPAEFQLQAAHLLSAALGGLKGTARGESWVPRGLAELSRLTPDLARPLCEQMISERRFFFFKAWPASARQAAELALAATGPEAN